MADNESGQPAVESKQSTVTFGMVNGVFLRKIPVTFVIYPEIADQIKHIIQTLEYVYETGIRRGMNIQTEVPPPIVQDPTMSTTSKLEAH